MSIRALRDAHHAWGRPGFHLVAANTGEHKTTLTRQDAAFAARHGMRVLFWPCEGRPESMEVRDVSSQTTRLSTTDLYRDRHPGSDGAEALRALRDDAAPGLRYVRRPAPTLQQVTSTLRIEATRGLHAAFIDHLHMLRGDDSPTYWDTVGVTLANLAIELNLAIVCSAQLNQPGMLKVLQGGNPTGADIQHGGKLKRSATSVYMLSIKRIPDPLPKEVGPDLRLAIQLEAEGKRVVRIECDKNREGPQGRWLLVCDPAHDTIGDEIDAREWTIRN